MKPLEWFCGCKQVPSRSPQPKGKVPLVTQQKTYHSTCCNILRRAFSANLFPLLQQLHELGRSRKIVNGFYGHALWCVVPDVKFASAAHFDASMTLANGHYVLWAWYLAMFRALRNSALRLQNEPVICLSVKLKKGVLKIVPVVDAKDQVWMSLLWEAACSVTIQLHIADSDAKLRLLKNQASEIIKTIGHVNMSDTFLTFARLVEALKIEKVAQGKEQNLRWSNTLYDEALHRAALSIIPALKDTGFVSAMLALDMEYGREILSSQYSKLVRLAAVCKAAASAERSQVELMSWLVGMLPLAFRTRLCLPSKAAEAFLDRDRKSGLAGFWNASLVCLQATSFFKLNFAFLQCAMLMCLPFLVCDMKINRINVLPPLALKAWVPHRFGLQSLSP